MGWFRKRRKGSKSAASPDEPTSPEPAVPDVSSLDFAGLETDADLDLPALEAQLERCLPHVLEQPVDRLLLHARLADAYRDEDLEPMRADAFLEATRQLSDEAWRRLSLLVGLLELLECRLGVVEVLDDDDVASQVEQAFIGFAQEANLLTVAILRDSELRREELLRRFILRLGAGIEGETIEQSLRRLERLDYGVLLGEAERARQIAEERMAYLKMLQEAQDAARAPRGKW